MASRDEPELDGLNVWDSSELGVPLVERDCRRWPCGRRRRRVLSARTSAAVSGERERARRERGDRSWSPALEGVPEPCVSELAGEEGGSGLGSGGGSVRMCWCSRLDSVRLVPSADRP